VHFSRSLCRETGLEDKLVCLLKLVAVGVMELVYNLDRPAFLKSKLVGFRVDKYQ
jgi:hypothetical protein